MVSLKSLRMTHVEDSQSLVRLGKSPSFPELSFVARSAYITSDRRANSSERNGVYRFEGLRKRRTSG